MKNPCRRWRQLVGAITTLSMLALAGTTAGLLGWLFYTLDTPIGVKVAKGFRLHINGEHRFMVLSASTHLPVITGTLATGLEEQSLNLKSSRDNFAHLVASNLDLRISIESEENIQIYTIQWHYNGKKNMKQPLQDCFSLKEATWFASHSEFKYPWPIENVQFNTTNFLSSIAIYDKFWLSSNGVAIVMPSNLPMQLTFNITDSNTLCFQSYSFTQMLKLKYKIIVGPDIKHVHTYIASLIPKPMDIPPASIFTNLTWSLYTSHWKSLQLEMYVKVILSHKFNGSLLLFDDDYIQNYIESYSKKDKYMNENKLTLDNEWVDLFQNELGYVKRRGFCPTLSVSFDLTESELQWKPLIGLGGWGGLNTAQQTEVFKGFNIRHSDKKRFHAMISAMHEMSICNAAVRAKVSADISSISTLQQNPITRNLHLMRSLVNQTLAAFGHSLVSQNVASPQMHQFILMEERLPEWNVLTSILPDAFSLGITGYPFLMAPALAPKNTMLADTNSFDSELYIRWMQLVALFPAVHINIPPWIFPPEVVDLVHDILAIRSKYLHVIFDAANSAIHSGLPIIRPMWMLEATTNLAVISINDQFSIAMDVIVAPIIKKNSRSRRIYLPSGEWFDTLNSKSFTGPKWIENFTVSLEQLPIFTRIKKQD